MKKLFALLAISTTLIFSSCTVEGPPGPPGPPGFDGQDGISLLGQVFEAQITFNSSNGFGELVQFPTSIEVFESDVVLVYWLEEVIPECGGGPCDVWTPLPQTIYVDGKGSFQYTFNHTFFDANIFLQGDFNLNTLGSGFTDDQVFRIAILPAEYGDANLSMDELLESLNFEEINIETISD